MRAEPLLQGVADAAAHGRRFVRSRHPPQFRRLLRQDHARCGRAADVVKPFEPLSPGGRGWRIVVDELVVSTRIGLHAHEHRAPQPVAIDASLLYRGVPDEAATHELIDYEAWCERVSSFLETKPHTRLLE